MAKIQTSVTIPLDLKRRMKAVRTTVSQSADLRQRMNDVQGDVNWSAVACAGFEQKLGELAAQREKKTMDDVIQRLRVSKLKATDDRYKAGFKDGQKWAMDEASASELEQLSADGIGFMGALSLADKTDDHTHGRYLQGRCDGALEIWGQVKDLI